MTAYKIYNQRINNSFKDHLFIFILIDNCVVYILLSECNIQTIIYLNAKCTPARVTLN